MTDPLHADERWRRRPLLALALRSLVTMVPVVAAVAAAVAYYQLRPAPDSVGDEFWRWTGVVLISTATIFAVERLARRLLPLAALLELSLLFPDRAPDRYRMAIRANSVRKLRADLERQDAAGATPVEAAETMLALLVSLRLHDGRTRGHSERTRAYADVIAREMGISGRDRERLGWAALLHDIGKLVVRPAVLNKEGVLDDREWDAVRHHPEAGARLVEPLRSFLGEWVDAISHHHERWDGTGYPKSLAGTDIHLGARIVAVADAYEVMTSPRSYRKPVSPRTARAEIALNAGTQFDPDVVRALLRVSIGRLNRMMAPVAWLFTLPFTGWLRKGIDAAAALGSSPAAATSDGSGGTSFDDALSSFEDR